MMRSQAGSKACHPTFGTRGETVRADTSDVAFRLLLSLGEVWEGIQRANIDPTKRGLHLTKEHLGGYTRYCAGAGAKPDLIVEWNESSRHLRVLRCEEWSGFEATISATVAYVREEARGRGILDVLDAVFVRACQDTRSVRRTIVHTASTPRQALAAVGRRA